jgi:uncharacterized protein
MGIDRGRRRTVATLAMALAGPARALGGAVAPVPSGGPRVVEAVDGEPGPPVLCAWQTGDDHSVGALARDSSGARFGPVAPRVPLPFRPHDLVPHPEMAGCAIAVARRPGDYLARVRWREGRVDALIDADAERVFEGHACFSPDGRFLLTTETDVRTGGGLVARRDARTLTTLDEWPLPGIGPHAIRVGPEGALWVALGGILTLPETGRTKRDLDRMDSTLVRLSLADGRVTGTWRLPDARLGIRHLAFSAKGTVGAALQAEHEEPERRARAPVLAILRDGGLWLASVPPGLATAGYGADIAGLPGNPGAAFAVSCPRADRIGLWGADGTWQGSVPLARARALAAFGSHLLAASEDGGMLDLPVEGRQTRGGGAAPDWGRRIDTGLALDNHMALVAD